MALVDVAVFGEAGLVAGRRDEDGRPLADTARAGILAA